ncbi:MAG: hypothetical protein IPP35_12160 [Elusimicrobia bacterium]|nr:hypothetical protein [Elusimicrobiota bacterium]
MPCLDEVRAIARYAPRLLVFLYYSLDNRPFYYRWALQAVTLARTILCQIRGLGFLAVVLLAGCGVYLQTVGGVGAVC